MSPPSPIELILRNLVANAFAHHDGGEPRIEIRLSTRGEDLVIDVSDNGPGIPLEQREAVFSMFRRLSAKAGGTGMGLAFVRRAAESLGGACTALQAPAGRGALLRTSIPGVVVRSSRATEGALPARAALPSGQTAGSSELRQ